MASSHDPSKWKFNFITQGASGTIVFPLIRAAHSEAMLYEHSDQNKRHPL